MSEYYTNIDLQGYQMQEDSFKSLHDTWVSAEPKPPEEPQKYSAREITEPTEINSSQGPLLVIPPGYIMTGEDGIEFAISDWQLENDYTLVLEVEVHKA